MDAAALRAVAGRRPYSPFVLRMSDGQEYPIAHPDLLAISTRDVVILLPAERQYVHLEPLLIASLRYQAPDQ